MLSASGSSGHNSKRQLKVYRNSNPIKRTISAATVHSTLPARGFPKNAHLPDKRFVFSRDLVSSTITTCCNRLYGATVLPKLTRTHPHGGLCRPSGLWWNRGSSRPRLMTQMCGSNVLLSFS